MFRQLTEEERSSQWTVLCQPGWSC